MRPHQHHRALPYRLDRVLPTAVDQRAADESHRSQLVEQAELADGVDDIGIAGPVGQLADRAPGHLEAAALQHLGNCPAALGMARRDDGAQVGTVFGQRTVGIGDDGVLAVVCAGGNQQRAAIEHGSQPLQHGAVDRRRRGIDLEVAGGNRARRTKLGKAEGQAFVLRQHQRKSAEQRMRDARTPPPSAE